MTHRATSAFVHKNWSGDENNNYRVGKKMRRNEVFRAKIMFIEKKGMEKTMAQYSVVVLVVRLEPYKP